MAAISPTITRKTTENKITVTWTTVTENDTFVAYTVPQYMRDISMHVSGTFGSATVVVKGANNGGAGVGLTNTADTTISLTAEGMFSVLERPATIQPVASGGSSQSLTVTAVFWI